jgi:hypothetical protein
MAMVQVAKAVFAQGVLMIGAIAGGAPTWVYGLLAVLAALGIRRLKTREVPLAVAYIPVVAFSAWSVIGAVTFAARAGGGLATLAWLGGALLGAATSYLWPDPKATRLEAGRIRLPGSWLPLILYLSVFIVRFACGAWAAIVPAQATLAIATGVAVSATMTMRLAVGTLSWRTAA